MLSALYILSVIILLMAVFVVVMNWVYFLANIKNRKKGIARHHAMVPLLSIFLTTVASLGLHEFQWIWIIPMFDLATWCLPWLAFDLVRKSLMKRSKFRPYTIAIIILAMAGFPLILHQWKLGADRSECLLNMRSMYVGAYSYAGVEGSGGPGQEIPGGWRGLLERSGHYPKGLPVCPSGGVYTFVSETTLSMNGVNNNIRCSRAHDLDHVYKDDPREGIMAEQDAP